MEFDNKVRECMRQLEQEIPESFSDADGILMIGEMYARYGPEAIKEAVHRIEMGR